MKEEKTTFSLSDKEAKEIYDSPDRAKALLEKTFPFLRGDITKRLQTIEDVFNELNVTQAEFDKNTVGLASHKVGAELVEMIAKAFNEGKDHLECFYFPYFRKSKETSKPSGFGLSSRDYGDSLTYTRVGSRQQFFNSDHAILAGKRFTSIYEQALLS